LKLLKVVLLCGLLLVAKSVFAASFVVEDIEVRGIKKISVGTVLNYLPVKAGDSFDYTEAPKVIKELYKTGFFNNITLLQENNSLIIEVEERPAIAEVNFDGNKELNDDVMKDALKQTGLTKGKIYNPKLLEKLEQELQQLYYSLGKYSARVDIKATQLDADRVQVDIEISEGAPAKIRSINLIGNHDFSDQDLLDEFDLVPTDDAWFGSDKYSSTKLSGDLESLKSFYLDQGYVRFNVESKQVSITPDKKDINIAINMMEGDQYTIKEIKLTGDLIVPEEELKALLTLRSGDIFSRKNITASIKRMNRRLGDEGYAFANVRSLPDIDDETKTVTLTLLVDPGKKMMVRQIVFEGNAQTRETVLRRELRQFEGTQYSQSLMDRSRVRLQRLKYISAVDMRNVKVPGEPDQMDVVFNVTERFSGSFTVGLGYSQSQGALFNLGLTHDNIFGSGNQLGFVFNNSSADEQYEFTYLNPYYTPDGISRGFSAKYTKTDASKANITNYLLDKVQLSVNYGIPLSEYNKIHFSLGLVRNDLSISDSSSDEVKNFIVENNDDITSTTDLTGDVYDDAFISVSFSKDSRNRSIFPDTGSLNSVGIEIYGGDLDYYKALYRHQTVFPVGAGITFSFKGRLGYGEAYGDTTDLPFFTKYTAGGVRTVRGYDYNSLGPRDSKDQVFGGNFQVITNSEFLLPVDALGGAESFRLGLYFDAGNVFADSSDYDSAELRTSAGISAKWFTLIGPIELSYAVPLNDKPGDETKNFQFSLGAPF
jgi:outer membrane protein insertion porin family